MSDTCAVKRCRKPTKIGYEIPKRRVSICWGHWERHCDDNDKFKISEETVVPGLKEEQGN